MTPTHLALLRAHHHGAHTSLLRHVYHVLLRCSHNERHTIATRRHSHDDVERLNVDAIGLVRALVRFDPTETAMKVRSITDAQNLVDLIFCVG